MSLVLSLFPGIGMLDHAFEREGFCVVRGPDVIWGGDIRTFHPPAGVFDGIIGGDPCQSHSALANLVRAKGLEPSFPDMTLDYQRIVELARPAWFLRENTPMATDIKPAGYDVRSFLLDNSTLDSGDGWGHEQMRRRKFWFGTRDGDAPELRKWIDFALTLNPEPALTVNGSHAGPNDAALVSMSHYSLEEMLRLQGFPEDWMKHQPWTMQAKRKMVGNGVALPTGRALARAIRTWQEQESWSD